MCIRRQTRPIPCGSPPPAGSRRYKRNREHLASVRPVQPAQAHDDGRGISRSTRRRTRRGSARPQSRRQVVEERAERTGKRLKRIETMTWKPDESDWCSTAAGGSDLLRCSRSAPSRAHRGAGNGGLTFLTVPKFHRRPTARDRDFRQLAAADLLDRLAVGDRPHGRSLRTVCVEQRETTDDEHHDEKERRDDAPSRRRWDRDHRELA
jgi:hypothetical protein